MKLWKKVVAMTLCLGFSFSAVGCDLFSSEESSNSGSESSPNQSAPNDSSDIVIPEDADSFIDVISTAKSARIKIEMAEYTKSLYEGDDAFDVETQQINVVLDILVSENTSGEANAKITMTRSASASFNGEVSEGDALENIAYIIDGYGYAYDASADCYVNEGEISLEEAITDWLGIPMEDLAMILEQVGGAMEDAGISTDDLIGALEDGFDASANIEDGALMTTIDFSAPANDLLDYLGTIEATTIVGDIVNDVLGLIDPSLNYADILDTIAPLGEVTVSEAYAELDAVVEAEVGLGIQEYKDLLIMNASVISALKDAGMTTEDIQAIAALNIEESFLVPYGDYTLNEFIIEMFEVEGAPEDLIGEVCVAAKDYLATTTFEQFEMDIGAEGLLNIFEVLSQLDCTDLAIKFGVKYDNNYNVEAGIFNFKLGLEMPVQMETNGGTLTEKQDASIDVKVTVSEISDERVAIALDAGVEIVTACDYCYTNYLSNGSELKYYAEYDEHICDECYDMYFDISDVE